MHIPVLKKNQDGTSKLIHLDLNDVIYICVENRKLMYHTIDESYFHISTLSDLEEHLTSFDFCLTDKTNLVNFRKIKKIDTKQGKIFFDDQTPSSEKYATIAFSKQKKLKNKIQRFITENNNTPLHYSLKEIRDVNKTANFKK